MRVCCFQNGSNFVNLKRMYNNSLQICFIGPFPSRKYLLIVLSFVESDQTATFHVNQSYMQKIHEWILCCSWLRVKITQLWIFIHIFQHQFLFSLMIDLDHLWIAWERLRYLCLRAINLVVSNLMNGLPNSTPFYPHHTRVNPDR